MPARRFVAAFAALLVAGPACRYWKPVPLADVQVTRSELGKLDRTVLLRALLHDGRTETFKLTRLALPMLEGVSPASNEAVLLDVHQVAQLEVQVLDPVASTVATVMVGAPVAYAIAMIIAILMKTSCPFVLVERDGRLELVGEAYSGAVARGIQRADLLPLPAPAPGRMRLVLANEAHETQYTDLAVLVLVDHDPALRALSTHDARLVLAGPARAPRRVEDLDGRDATAAVAAADGRLWSTDLEAAARRADPPGEEGLVARFDAPAGPLVLEIFGGSTPWLDVVFGRWFALFGDKLGQGLELFNDPGRGPRMQAWMERSGAHLRVDVRDAQRWRRVAVVPPAGPMALRNIAIRLGKRDAAGPLEVRLSGAVGFLRVDSLALSVAEPEEPAALQVAPALARAHDGGDARPGLRAVDGDYDVLARIGERTELGFDVPPAVEGRARSAFLLTSGYYNVHRPPQSERNLAMLRQMQREPEALGRFSLDLFRGYAARLALAAPAAGTP